MPASAAADLNLERDAPVGSLEPISCHSPEPFNNATPSHRVLDIEPRTRREVLLHETLPSASSVPLRCHGIRSKQLAWKTPHLLRDALISLFFAITMITSFGLPYWYYWNYRLQPPRHKEAETPEAQRQSVLAQWLLTLKRLRSQWKSFLTLSIGVLPVILPILNTYPIQRCSWPFLLSAVALLSGLTTLVITSLYRCHSDAFRHESASRVWHEASLSPSNTSLTKAFWVLASMPMIWFLYLIIALVTSIIVIVWEQASTEISLGGLCLPWHVKIFRATLLTFVCTASAHLIFVVSVLLFAFE